MESSDIRYEVEGCVAIITVDRPEGLQRIGNSKALYGSEKRHYV